MHNSKAILSSAKQSKAQRRPSLSLYETQYSAEYKIPPASPVVYLLGVDAATHKQDAHAGHTLCAVGSNISRWSKWNGSWNGWMVGFQFHQKKERNVVVKYIIFVWVEEAGSRFIHAWPLSLSLGDHTLLLTDFTVWIFTLLTTPVCTEYIIVLQFNFKKQCTLSIKCVKCQNVSTHCVQSCD